MGGVCASQQRRAGGHVGQPGASDAGQRTQELRLRARTRKADRRGQDADQRRGGCARPGRAAAGPGAVSDRAQDRDDYGREGQVVPGAEQPWHTIKTDRERAGTVLYVALRCVDNLKMMLTPFLPFSSQRLHRMLGYEDVIAEQPEVREVVEDGAAHSVLTGDYSSEDRWKPSTLPAGRKLPVPEALFKRLDPVVEEEQATSS